MTRPQQQFLELLRSGLWGKPADASIFQGEIDWQSIVRIAKEQTVQVLVANGIETLPKELWPPKAAIFKLMEYKSTTVKMHHLLNSVLAKITTALNAEGIPSVLLKGQGLAQNYLIPETRICGDIDLYVGEENIDRACEVIAGLTDEPQEPEEGLTGEEMHRHVKVDGVVIEVHRKSVTTHTERLARLMRNWTHESLNSHFNDGTLPTINFNQVPVTVPSANFNNIFILYHAANHMLQGGIGLRQLCDWAMFLTKHHTEINETELKSNLRRFNMIPVWREFSRFIVNVLGLDPKHLPLAPHKLTCTKGTKFILNDIFDAGNFGHYKQHKIFPAETNVIIRKWRNCQISSQRHSQLIRFFPTFTISYIITWYINAFKRAFQGK